MILFRDSDGTPIRVDAGRVVGSGGEARVLAVAGDDSVVAKVYHAPSAAHARKLAAMRAAPPDDPGAREASGRRAIAWPIDLLRNDSARREVVGFLMPRVADVHPLFTFYNPSARRELCPLSNPLYLHRTARNLAAAVRALHARGYVIGDVNESNILAGETALVTLVDTDSFQVRDAETRAVFRCDVGKPDFTPPELQGKTFADLDRTPEHDRFGLAVLIFQLLLEGTHPFAGVHAGTGEPPPYEERIRAGHFPHGRRAVPYRPMPAAPPCHILSPTLQYLFVRCFEDGHADPSARPDAATWQSALAEAEDALVVCPVNTQHRYGAHLDACPWCVRRDRLNGRDPFPSPEAVRAGANRAKLSPRRADSDAPTGPATGAGVGPASSGSWRGAAVLLPQGMTLAGARAAMGAASGSGSASGSSAGWGVAASVGGSASGAPVVNAPTVVLPKNRWAWGALAFAVLAWLPAPVGLAFALAAFAAAGRGLWNSVRPGSDGRGIALGAAGLAAPAFLLGAWGLFRLVVPPEVMVLTRGGGGAVRSLAFTPDGRTLAAGTGRAQDMSSTRGAAVLWDARGGASLGAVSSYVGDASAVAFAPGGTRLAVGNSGPHDPAGLEVWDSRRGDRLWRRMAHREAISAVAFSPDGGELASGGFREFVRTRTIIGELKLWDARTGDLRRAWDFPGEVLSLAFAPGGARIAVGTGSSSSARAGEPGCVSLVDARTGERLWSRPAHGLACESVAFAPDGRTLASAGGDNAVRLWDAATGRRVRTLETPDRWIGATAFSPDGLLVAAGSSGGRVRLFDAATGRLVRALPEQGGPVSALAFSPKERLLATGSGSGELVLWRLPRPAP